MAISYRWYLLIKKNNSGRFKNWLVEYNLFWVYHLLMLYYTFLWFFGFLSQLSQHLSEKAKKSSNFAYQLKPNNQIQLFLTQNLSACLYEYHHNFFLYWKLLIQFLISKCETRVVFFVCYKICSDFQNHVLKLKRANLIDVYFLKAILFLCKSISSQPKVVSTMSKGQKISKHFIFFQGWTSLIKN